MDAVLPPPRDICVVALGAEMGEREGRGIGIFKRLP